ncbi:MAG: alpha-L-rhamnosidase N-terminal domain-containing protein, partial [Armatimonadetes bacterium]|nr:alpha-L-rhamnosidase N-terminal domain-containing protein [Armatimonadota bacterium]
AYCQVRVWDRDGRPSAWSAPSWWETALPRPEDWKARWIVRGDPPLTEPRRHFQERPNPLFRREFTLGKEVRRARAYVSGLGYYELRLNGQRVGDRVLDPAWTDYSKRVFYSTYDVTELLRRGGNALGVMLGEYGAETIWSIAAMVMRQATYSISINGRLGWNI